MSSPPAGCWGTVDGWRRGASADDDAGRNASAVAIGVAVGVGDVLDSLELICAEPGAVLLGAGVGDDLVVDAELDHLLATDGAVDLRLVVHLVFERAAGAAELSAGTLEVLALAAVHGPVAAVRAVPSVDQPDDQVDRPEDESDDEPDEASGDHEDRDHQKGGADPAERV